MNCSEVFCFIFLLFPLKVAWGQAHSSQAGFSLRIRERRILRLLHRILWLTFGSLFFFYSDIEPLSKYSPLSMLHLLLLLEFLIKTLARGNLQPPTLTDSPSKSFIQVNDALFYFILRTPTSSSNHYTPRRLQVIPGFEENR